MNEIVEKIHALGFSEYGVCTYENSTYLLVFMDYGYYRESNPENFQISPYYFASNHCYFATKELCSYISDLGYSAVMENKILYDPVLEQCGAKRGDNNLFYIKSSGSLFCVHVILTDAALDGRSVGARECNHCGACICACPMGALSENGIDSERCLRHRMDKIGDVECVEKISRLLGCDECQRVCPINDTIEKADTFSVFNKHKIISGDLSGISELVGTNMARKSRLQFQAMAIAARDKDSELLKTIQSAVVVNSLEELRDRCINLLKNC